MADKKTITCLILDRNLDSDFSAKLLSEGSKRFKEVIIESSETQIMKTLSQKNIDLVIIDESFDIFENLVVLKRIFQENFNGKIIILSPFINPLHSEIYMQSSVDAYISKKETMGFVFSCINNVLNGYILFEAKNSDSTHPYFYINKLMVLLLLLQGQPTHIISNTLALDETLVNQIKSRIQTKYNIKNIPELCEQH
ncbi:response regulator transcription factor [Vibrio sp. B1FLJ16]|uniref:response regulator transcription factor n=1 Tax=Vibrio sp. B1FLJ16 TaxID=2751178 RepID=UPI0015F50D1F|nr:response regulator transcription factor [Vibrio sp. B1FLJ16]CAD7807181.1 Response regulator containing a CheY-like receiver domain and an HTH DNA-binding domain [Vibrio sp. B1FLJ16]CAE6905041.1 Response regulator containing a CheY-like receiver domain and an HTH DNA-binding domain [Vibrio sp. B1FLJ16]